ncbi:hypothetical protein HaLaN_17537 [Haematococcus lacustris]|uniref:Uncharacterized protein n=1 Tax=Haematococcus lacustris TaxID=44745 RepID=A0A699ZWW2_HAELA|nr:hypothetical protein HaLaN_17537 [Haematococcus lacustris]
MNDDVLQLAGPAYTSQEQPGSHALKLPPPSEALAKQLSQSRRCVLGSQLRSFVSALDSGNSLESADDELDKLAVNSYVCLAQALRDLFARQEEAFALKMISTTCHNKGRSIAPGYAPAKEP